MVKRGDMMSVDDVTEILAVNLLGVIPDDEQVVIATNRGEAVAGEECLAGRSYMDICRRLTGEDVPVNDYSKSEGFFGKIAQFFIEIRRKTDECSFSFDRQIPAEESACRRQNALYGRFDGTNEK